MGRWIWRAGAGVLALALAVMLIAADKTPRKAGDPRWLTQTPQPLVAGDEGLDDAMAYLDPTSNASETTTNGDVWTNGYTSINSGTRQPSVPSSAGVTLTVQNDTGAHSSSKTFGMGNLANNSSTLTLWVYQSGNAGYSWNGGTSSVNLNVNGTPQTAQTIGSPSITGGWQSYAFTGSFTAGQAIQFTFATSGVDVQDSPGTFLFLSAYIDDGGGGGGGPTVAQKGSGFFAFPP